MDTLTGVIIVIVAAIVVGFIAGNGAVYMFNRLPDTWLCDYGEEPSKEVSVEGGQRIKSWPWKWVFSASFIVVGIYMGVSDWQYAVAGLCACWLLLLLAWADGKYKILPDQLILVLAVMALGFLPVGADAMTMIKGLAVGGGIMLGIWAIARAIYGKEAMGFGDVKLCAAMGLLVGWHGALFVIAAGSFGCGIYGGIQIIVRHLTRKDTVPMGPFLCGAGAAYIVILHQWF